MDERSGGQGFLCALVGHARRVNLPQDSDVASQTTDQSQAINNTYTDVICGGQQLQLLQSLKARNISTEDVGFEPMHWDEDLVGVTCLAPPVRKSPKKQCQ